MIAALRAWWRGLARRERLLGGLHLVDVVLGAVDSAHLPGRVDGEVDVVHGNAEEVRVAVLGAHRRSSLVVAHQRAGAGDQAVRHQDRAELFPNRGSGRRFPNIRCAGIFVSV